jgi:hypothetical protein
MCRHSTCTSTAALWLAAVLLGYGLAAELAKRLYLRRRLPWW